jgi:alpha-D-ribose 1-methylphosphonate 5-triphosphate diphosphatase
VLMPESRNNLILTNAKLVLENEVISGTIEVENGLIKSIDQTNTGLSNAVNCSGMYVSPGIIELHTDNIERHMEPRPGVSWPIKTAVLAHDTEMGSCGITTVFDALRVGSISKSSARYAAYARIVANAILELKKEKLFKIDHLIHLRAEVCSETLIDEISDFSPTDHVGIISLMDHTPGQRQWRDLKKLKEFVQGKKKVDDHDFSEHVSTLKALRNKHGESHERFVCEQAKKLNVVLASHDDTTKEHVEEAATRGVKIAEFPTTKEAAISCKEKNIAIMMGAPNLIRKGSHSGNVSALELAQDDLLDIVSSDYVPAALFQSSMVLADLWGSLPKAMRTVTLSPAKASGLQDRGVIDIGKKADLIMFDRRKDFSLMKSVWSDGCSIF